MPIALFQYMLVYKAKYDTSMRLINEVQNIQTSYKTEYDMPKYTHFYIQY